MAEPTPNIPPTTKGGANFLTKKLGGMPVWTWGLIVLAGVGVGLFFLKKQQGSTSTTSTANSPAQAAIGDMSTTPSGEQVPNTTGDQVFVVSPPTPLPPSPPTSPVTPVQTYTIRQTGKAPGWDEQHFGVPFTDSPGGLGGSNYVPWGATVTSNGNPVTGPDGGIHGSTYYPVTYNGKSGFVSAWDTVGVGSGGPVNHRYQSNALSVLSEY